MNKIIVERLTNGNFRLTTTNGDRDQIETCRSYEKAMTVVTTVREMLNLLRPYKVNLPFPNNDSGGS